MTPSQRWDQFVGLEHHAFYGPMFKRLKAPDLALAGEVIRTYKDLGHFEFNKAMSRHWLDKERPKRWADLEEMLVVANNLAQEKSNETPK